MTKRIWFTSDLHIGHKLVSGLRGFWKLDIDGVRVVDTEAHDRALAENWDATVGPEDEVWVLGDLSINSGAQVLAWFADRPGIIHLVSGNHDQTHSLFGPTKSSRKLAEWVPHFASIQDEATIVIAGKTVTLSHFPYWSFGDGHDRATARYEKWRPVESDTAILLHGHTHGTETAHERSFHVGLDAHGLHLVPESVIAHWVDSL